MPCEPLDGAQETGTYSKARDGCHVLTFSGRDMTIQTLEDMLRACVLEFKGNWVLHLSLVKFAYNNSYQANIDMAPYKALYRRKCQTPFCQDEVGERKLEDVELIEATSEKIKIIRERLKAT